MHLQSALHFIFFFRSIMKCIVLLDIAIYRNDCSRFALEWEVGRAGRINHARMGGGRMDLLHTILILAYINSN